MARVPFVDAAGLDAAALDAAGRQELAPLVARISGARRGRLINVYRVLLNSPPLAETWFEHLNAVRWKTTLDGRLRELVIIRIGYLLDVPYILKQHIPKLAEADGVSVAECAGLAEWAAFDGFSARERAVLAYTDAVTREAKAGDEVFEPLREHFDAQGIVELTVLVGTYNMHARVMNALALDLEKD